MLFPQPTLLQYRVCAEIVDLVAEVVEISSLAGEVTAIRSALGGQVKVARPIA